MSSQEKAIETAELRGLTFPRPCMGDVYKVVYALSWAQSNLNYYTYVGDGRSQTVVCKRKNETIPDYGALDMSSVHELDFSNDWLSELPEWFHPLGEKEMLHAFNNSLISTREKH